MADAAALAALREAVGDGALTQHAPLDIDGVQVAFTAEPEDAVTLAAGLAACGRAGLAALVRGGGQRLALGNPPQRGDVVVSTAGLVGVDEFDASEGVCHVLAGTPIEAVRETVREGGWELPLDPPGDASTVGGVIAAGAFGPRALAFGLPRDVVLGLEVSLATGERIRCGGRVVKNVTGYDLGKLFTGSLGTLGVIEAAWLRLRPLPAARCELVASFETVGAACRFGAAAARRSSARAVALLRSAEGAALRVVLELGGDAESVEADQSALRERAHLEDSDGQLERARELQGHAGPRLARFRLALLPSALPDALEKLSGEGVSLLAYPGLGVVYAGVPVSAGPGRDPVAAERAFALAAGASPRPGSSFLCEAAPAWMKHGRDVFGAEQASLTLQRSLKQRYDPHAVLNPGRFAGGI